MSQGFYGLLDFIGLPVAQGSGKVFYMLNEILGNIVTDIQGLNLALNGNSVPVVKRKGVKSQPDVDQPTQITVCKDPRERLKIEYVGFQKASALYPITINIVSPNPRDWATNLDTYINWWDLLIGLYIPPNLTTTSLWGTTASNLKVWDVKVDPGDFLEPEHMAQQFDVVDINLEIRATLVS